MDLKELFSIPLWDSEYPDFDSRQKQFTDALREFRKNNPSVTNRGYQSPKSLHKVQDLAPVCEYASQLAQKAVYDLDMFEADTPIVAGWAFYQDSISSRALDLIYRHTFTAIFLAETRDERNPVVEITNSDSFKDWVGNVLVAEKNAFNASSIDVDLSPGQMIMIPSYLDYRIKMSQVGEDPLDQSAAVFHVLALPKG